MKKYLKNFMKYRHLLGELVKKDIKLKYRRSYLGILWTLIEPLLTMIVLSTVFGSLYGRTDRTFPVYVLTGRLLYAYFANSTKACMRSIRSHSGMIKKVYVPKYIYPLSSVCSNYVTFLISLIVLVVVSIVLKVNINAYILLSFIPLLLMFIMAYGVGMILATLSVFFRDLEYLWSVALMIIMYTAAIFYPVERLYTTGKGWILELNPLYSLISLFRSCVFGYPMEMRHLLYAGIFSVGSLIIGLLLFYKKQDKFILYV
ncbi:MAG: ABC transporter permease [Clostridium sp.]|nr:ABC transporter permease [Clostridium sp.]